MIVCHCRAVSHREVADAIERGAATPGDVARECGAGAVCGGCRPTVVMLLARSQRPRRLLATHP